MNETKFNAELRAILRVQGWWALHIREADQPGAADLVMWQGPHSVTWAELKIEDHEVEPHQWQFLEDRVKEGFCAYVVRLRGSHAVEVARVVGHGHKLTTPVHTADFRKAKWTEILR